MFYPTPELPRGLFKACIVPRPIAWISTIDRNGELNLAPFSYFNAVCDEPPMIMFSATNAHFEGGPKDTLKNIEEVGEFVVNIATYDMRLHVNESSADLPRNCNEFDYANVEYEDSELIKPPRVKNSPIHLECLYHTSVQLPSNRSKEIINRMVIGRVIGINVKKEVMTDGLLDIRKIQPIARLGYNDYATIDNIFKMLRPC